MDRIETNLKQLRQTRGLSAAALAAMVQVSRQTVHAIESGDYVPNTAVALRMARVLDVTVEDLFALPGAAAQEARLLPDSSPPHAGEPVQLCRVDRKLIAASASADPWCLPASDAVVTGALRQPGRAIVQAYDSQGDFQNRILLAGCDPAVSVLARHLQPAGVELVFVQRNSSQALQLLRGNCVHVAGTHLRDEVTGESNIPEVTRIFPKRSVVLFSFAVWEEGILAAHDNPKGIKGAADLARKNICIVNREEGSGSRRLLDNQLKHEGVDSKRVRGYSHLATGHFSAARLVAQGSVDCCIATRATARVFGLHFIPLLTERYDLAVRRIHLKLPAVETMLDALNRSAFRRELEGVGGYETAGTGRRMM